MKGVILAAGPGEDLKPITDAISKPMIRILDKPMLQYAIERLVLNGVKDIIIVVNDKQVEIRKYFGNGKDFHTTIHYVVQKGEGINQAILSVEGLIPEEESFVLSHCDIIAGKELLSRTLNAADNNGAEMAIAVALQSEVQDFGLVNLDSNGLVSKVILPDQGESGNYVVAGTFLLTHKIFDYLNQGIAFNQCFNHYINDGGKVAAGIWNEAWIDVGRPWDILRANTLVLQSLEETRISNEAIIETNVAIQGVVIIEKGVKILNGAIIKGPVYIGANAFVGNNSLIRDYTVIDSGARIGMGVEVKSSAIMEYATIARLSYVGSSIVGPRSTIHSGVITIISKRPKSPITVLYGDQQITVPLPKFGSIIGPKSHIGEHSSLLPGTMVETETIIEPNTAIGGTIKK